MVWCNRYNDKQNSTKKHNDSQYSNKILHKNTNFALHIMTWLIADGNASGNLPRMPHTKFGHTKYYHHVPAVLSVSKKWKFSLSSGPSNLPRVPSSGNLKRLFTRLEVLPLPAFVTADPLPMDFERDGDLNDPLIHAFYGSQETLPCGISVKCVLYEAVMPKYSRIN